MSDWATVLGARPRMGIVGVCCVLGSMGGHSAWISRYLGTGMSPTPTPPDRTAPTGKGSLGQEGSGRERPVKALRDICSEPTACPGTPGTPEEDGITPEFLEAA